MTDFFQYLNEKHQSKPEKQPLRGTTKVMYDSLGKDISSIVERYMLPSFENVFEELKEKTEVTTVLVKQLIKLSTKNSCGIIVEESRNGPAYNSPFIKLSSIENNQLTSLKVSNIVKCLGFEYRIKRYHNTQNISSLWLKLGGPIDWNKLFGEIKPSLSNEITTLYEYIEVNHHLLLLKTKNEL